MNKQRKVVITTTYNEMGIIIDTKVEEVAQPNLQPSCNHLATDTISRQAVIDALEDAEDAFGYLTKDWREVLEQLPPIQPAEPQIIRCKDCKYAEYIDDVQTLWCTECGQGRTVAPDDFCSYADRREETT